MEFLRERELSKTLKRLSGRLSPEELASLESMTQAIVNKLLHNPTVFLKSRPSPAKLALAKEIFGLADVESRSETGEESYQEGEG